VNNWLRALSEVIKYRDGATQAITGDLCLALTKHLLDIFDASFNPADNFQPMVFRHSCVAVVYLLRRRVYENNYFDPEHPLARRAKKLFSLAQASDRKGLIRIPGGMVDLQKELQTLIDYIDRRGRGAIAMASMD
jgi:hypothetical protein